MPSLPSTSVTVDLTAIARVGASGEPRERKFFLFKHNERPIILGSGRYATVVLASTGEDVTMADELFAVKFLKRDAESDVFNRIGFQRFLEEVTSTGQFGDRADLVLFRGFGTVRPLTDAPAGVEEYPIVSQVAKIYGDRTPQHLKPSQFFDKLANANQQVAAFLENSGISVQGPFFVMQVEAG